MVSNALQRSKYRPPTIYFLPLYRIYSNDDWKLEQIMHYFVYIDGGWMPNLQRPKNCPPGLEYLSAIDKLLVHQKVDLVEGKFSVTF